jgi:alkylation response protein AidB-like acyl-CoA dehydrogenase
MDFYLTEEQNDVQATGKRDAHQEIGPMAQQLDQEVRFPDDFIRKCADLRLSGVSVAEEYGGESGKATQTAFWLLSNLPIMGQAHGGRLAFTTASGVYPRVRIRENDERVAADSLWWHGICQYEVCRRRHGVRPQCLDCGVET